MSVLIFDEDDARQRIRGMIDSGDWWVFPAVSDAAMQGMKAVESAHYNGEANADFEMMILGDRACGVFAIAFAHKRRMSAVELAEVVGQEIAGDRDIVGITGGDEYELLASRIRAMQFNRWLVGSDGWDAKPL